MKTITAICFFLLLFQAIFPANLIIGGGEEALAQAYREKYIYEVTIENNVSKVMTSMTVFADSQKDAADKVSLNGWKVVGIKMITEKKTETYELPTDTVNDSVPDKIRIAPGAVSLGSALTGPEENSPLAQGYPAGPGGENPYETESFEAEDNLDLLPASKELDFLFSVHFELGSVEPIRTAASDSKIETLDKNARYVLFGHADEVPVVANASYENNFELSYRRAQKLKDIMVRAGVPEGNIRAVGLGTAYHAVKAGPGNSLSNRRVEIYGFGKKK